MKLVSISLLKAIYDILITVQDEGPIGEGWKSDELITIISQIEDLLEMPNVS